MLFAFPLALALALTGDPAFSEGVRLYKETEYEQAIVLFQQVSARSELAPADKAESLLWLGLSYAGTGDVDTAREKLRSALEADATVALPKTSPAIASMFEELRVEVAAAQREPEPAPAAPAPKPAGGGDFVIIGGAVLAGGAVAVLTGGVLALLASSSLDTAKDTSQFQSDAKAALDAANGQALGAGVLLPLGAALAVAGGVLIAVSPGEP